MNKILITHTADIQVKNRKSFLYEATLNVLTDIENQVRILQNPIHIIAGDLFEYANPTESERELIFKHLVRLCQIPTLKEIVVIAGNHDLVKERKQQELEVGFNPINTFTSLLSLLNDENNQNTSKIRFFQETGIYQSIVEPNINWVVYSLQDREGNNWETLKSEILNDVNYQKKTYICLYHAMIQEYVRYDKIPLSETQLNKLDSVELFPNRSLICAGDIHKTLIFKGTNDQTFIYPGSPMQHTFAEGSYFSITKNGIEQKIADGKLLFVYEYSNGVLNHEPFEIELTQSINYYTISIDNGLGNNFVLEAFKCLKSLKIKNEPVIVKVRCGSEYLSIENELHQILGTIGADIILFQHDKLEVKDAKIDSYIEQVITEKLNGNDNLSIETSLSAETIQQLILENEQIVSLFKNSLSKLFDVDKTTFDLTVDLFTNELSQILDGQNQSYKIKLKQIETNGFMRLGSNCIDLEKDGITKILGTNGIGKTTLFKMIRYAICETISPNMIQSRPIQNSIPLFNKNKPKQDSLFVKLFLEVNGVDYKLERFVERVWKQSVTDEQKTEADWSNYISTIKRRLELTNSETNQILTGSEAEEVIKSWFGSIVDRLLFITNSKIETILNMQPKVLEQEIMTDIGVDYLSEFEKRLDSVKDKLFNHLTQPTSKLNELLDELKDIETRVNYYKTEIEEEKGLNESCEKRIKQLEEEKQSLIDQRQKFGDVETALRTKRNDYQTVTNFITSFDENETELPLIELTRQEPLDHNWLRNILNEKLTSVENQLKEIEQENISIEKQSRVFFNNHKQQIIEEAINVQSDLMFAVEQSKSTREILATLVAEGYDVIKTELNNYLSRLVDKQNQINTSYNSLRNDCAHLNLKIKKLEGSLEDKVCPTCKQPVNEKTEEEKQSIRLKIEEFKNLMNDNKSQFEKFDKQIALLNKIIVTFNKCLVFNPEQFITNCNPDSSSFNDEFKVVWDHLFLNHKTILGTIEKSLNQILQQLNDDKVLLVEYNQLKDFIDYKLVALIGQQKPIENFNGEFVKPLSTIENYNIVYVEFLSKQKESKDSLQQKSIECQKTKNRCNQLSSDLTDWLNQLNVSYREYVKEVMLENQRIAEQNRAIQERKINYTHMLKKQIELENEIKTLETNLVEYGNINARIEDVTQAIQNQYSLIKTGNETISKLENNSNLLILRKETIDKSIDNCKLWQQNELVWKVYQKMIKNHFKGVVFKYYLNFLNNTLNSILGDVNFKLYWNDGLQMVTTSPDKNGVMQVRYQSVAESSGMETTFLGLALIYTMTILNVKNPVSHIFIDELSGTLNNGMGLSYDAENYQELFKKLLSKFTDKQIFIVDHAIDELGQSTTYEVVPSSDNVESYFVQM